MRRILFTPTAVCLLWAIGAWGQAKHSDVGTWTLDIAHSDFGSGEKPKSVTLVILKDTPEMLSWRVQVVKADGKSYAYSWSGPKDGTMHPVMKDGKQMAMQSAKQEEDGALLRHGEGPDGGSFDARSRLSDDGNTINEEATSKDKDGKESKGKSVYHRVMAKKKAAA